LRISRIIERLKIASEASLARGRAFVVKGPGIEPDAAQNGLMLALNVDGLARDDGFEPLRVELIALVDRVVSYPGGRSVKRGKTEPLGNLRDGRA
jgi:hypothetical protein